MLTPKKIGLTEEQSLLDVYDNGTIISAVLSERTPTNLNLSSVSIAVIGRSDSVDSVSEANISQENCSIPNTNVDMSNTSSNAIQEDNENSFMLTQPSPAIESDLDMNQSIQQDYLNSSDTCSYDSRSSKRLRKKLKKYHHQPEIFTNHFPPPYTAIYFNTSGPEQPPAPLASRQSDNLHHMRPIDGGHHITMSAVPVIRRSHSNTNVKFCCGGWFTRPTVPFIIGVLALGGVSCTLGGIVLGSTGLIEHSTQYLSAALLMIGIGVSLLVISGAIWRLSIPDEIESCPCFRNANLEQNCRNCNSPFCNNRFISGGFMYPEFQHRPPPPSYVTSVHECTVRVLMPEIQCTQTEVARSASPPPSYRSFSRSSLSMMVPVHSLSQIPAAGSADISIENIECNTSCSSKDIETS